MAAPAQPPQRTVVHGDAFEWLATQPTLGERTCVVTSAPDRSEIREAFGSRTPTAEEYGAWLTETTRLIVSKVRVPREGYIPATPSSRPSRPACAHTRRAVDADTGLAREQLDAGCAAVFYQSDVRYDAGVDNPSAAAAGTHGAEDAGAWEYIDKSFLCTSGALKAGGRVMWHKLALRTRPDNLVLGVNPGYTHVMCYGSPRGTRLPPPCSPAVSNAPDVMSRGETDWARGAGAEATERIVRYLRDGLGARRIVDPFCGTGAVLAVAGAMGLESVGVECCKKRARVARGLAAEGSGKDMQLVRPGPPEDIAEEVEARRRRYIDHRKANVAQQKERARLEKQRQRAQQRQ